MSETMTDEQRRAEIAACTSDNVTCEVKTYQRLENDVTTEKRSLAMICADCQRFAEFALDPFLEAWVARTWNAHHARQMAARVAQILQREG